MEMTKAHGEYWNELQVLMRPRARSKIFTGALELREHAGRSPVSANVLIGAINLASTFVAMFTIDRIGPRILLLCGAAVLCVSLPGLGLAFHQERQNFAVIPGLNLA